MTARRPLFVIGAGGLGREAVQLARDADIDGHWDFRGYIAQPDEVGRKLTFGEVLGTDAWLLEHASEADGVIAIGDPPARERVVATLRAAGTRLAFPNLIHPTARLDRNHVRLGVGIAINAGCGFTIDIEIGDFAFFNPLTTVGHDTAVGRFSVVLPGANVAGGVRIGERVLVGAGAQVLQGLSVGDDAVIGAGAVVTKRVAPGITVVGVPARPVGNQ